MKKGLLLVVGLLGLLVVKRADAQVKYGDLKGTIYDSATVEPMLYANVVLEGTDFGTSADVNGFFNITKIPVGDYTMTITAVGHDKLTRSITITENRQLYVKIYLLETPQDLRTFEVSNDRIDRENTVNMSTFSLTPEVIRKMPSIGEPDLAQYLQVLPGVISSGDQGGQLYIRGGPPIQNKVLLDGAIIYNPFHSIGIFSVFDTDIIRSADVYTGGFGAQYGGRISSIMDITTREGNKKRFGGKIGINTFSAKAIIEGPIKKLKENSNTSASFLLSGRGSYLEQSSRVFYPYADSSGLPFNFWDIYAKISLNAGKQGSKLNIFGFTHNDMVNYSSITSIGWRSAGGGVNFVVVPAAANVKIDGVVSYSNYRIEMVENNDLQLTRKSEINAFNIGLNLHQFFGSNKITYGIETIGTGTSLDYDTPYNVRISNQENTTELAAFVKAQITRWGFVFDPSIRLHYYASLSEASVEPRLGLKYNVTPWFRLKAAGGMYSQNLVAANSDRDVVNLFYGFLSGEDDIPATFQGQDVESKLSKAQHGIFGMEFDITKYIQLNLEGYYMNFSQVLNVNRNKQYNNDANGQPDYLKKDIIVEKGYAAGMDFSAKFEYKGLYLWLVYSLMKTEREDEITTYSPHFDRTHNINIVANYKFGKKKDWEISARWNLGSGFPFTQTAGFYEFLDFQDGIGTDYTTDNGSLGIQYGEINKGRLPWYHRMDINVKKEFNFTKDLKLEVSVGASNIYNRENIFYIDRVTFTRVNQLPILYNVGATFEF